MAIKTILVHASSDDQRTARLQFALGLAKHHDARLMIVCNTTPVDMPETGVGRAASLGYLAEVRDQAEQKAAHIKQEVEELCGQVAYRWSITSGDHAVELAKSALCADLAVITQSHPKFLEDRVMPENLPDRLPLLSARPTLILPWSNPGRPDPKRVMVAWSSCREAGRAVGDALPFLQQAEQVVVTFFTADRKTSAAEKDSLGELERLREFLGGHGVRFEQVVRPKSGGHAGEKILEAVSEFKCDLLVMGSYGHTRWREVVFGGSTRTVLGGMITPVLMSH